MNFNYIDPHYELERPTLDSGDADLIANCLLHFNDDFNAHELVYNPVLSDEPLSVLNPNHQYFREFIENFLPPLLRVYLLSQTPINRLRICYSLLMHHNCNIENSCRDHLKLILKLKIIAAPCISRKTIDSDFKLFVEYRYHWDLMVCYFNRFKESFDLITFMLLVLPENAIQYFMESAVPDFYQYIPSWMDTIMHFLVNNILIERIEFFIKYGARNLDIQDFYEMYRNPLMLPEGLPVNSRIKMRVLQVYTMSIHDNKKTLRMLMAANMEPFLTKQQYTAVCNEFLPYFSEDPDGLVKLQQSWDWYSTIFGIQDDAMVTPRPLQHICRYLIRRNMARRKQLPHGVQLTVPLIIKNYIISTE